MTELKKARQELAKMIDWKAPTSSVDLATAPTFPHNVYSPAPLPVALDYTINRDQEQRVLTLLREHPCLASQYFRDCTPLKNKYPPLAFLVEHNASLNAIEEVYRHHPDAVQSKDRWGNTPLHFACKARTDPSILKFLLQHYPEAVTLPNRVGYYPLHFLMLHPGRRPLTRKMLRVILGRPSSKNNNDNSIGRLALKGETDLGLTPLQLALMKSNNIEPNVLEFLFQVAAEHPDKNHHPFSLIVNRTAGGCLNLDHAKAIARLLPTMDSCAYIPSCDGSTSCKWTDKAFDYLMQSMIGLGCETNNKRNNNNLQSLTLVLPRRILAPQSKACELLGQFMAADLPQLTTLMLRGDDDNDPALDGHDDACINALAKGLTCRPYALQTLKLRGFSLKTSSSLGSILASPTQLLSLKLFDMHVERPWVAGSDTMYLRNSKLTSLYLHLGSDSVSHWQLGLLEELVYLPRIERLTLECINNGPNLTPYIVALLSQPESSISHIQLVGGGCRVDHDRIATALHTTSNHKLQTYTYDDYHVISYYTNLNRFGAAQIVSVTNPCSKSQFVTLLAFAASACSPWGEDDATINGNNPRMDALDVFNVQYGLLSLSPSLWSTLLDVPPRGRCEDVPVAACIS